MVRSRPCTGRQLLWGHSRSPVRPPESARAFVDAALAQLAKEGHSPAAWFRFLAASGRRSLSDARQRPWALFEGLGLGTLLIAGGHRRSGLLVGSMVITHLGMLEGPDRGLGWANRLTLFRAALPALAPNRPVEAVSMALLTDLFDGRVARRTRPTAFGAYADSITDLVFWSWFVARHEPDRRWRTACLSIWLAPALAVAVGYFARGRSFDYPRPFAYRALSVACEVAAALRAAHRQSIRNPSVAMTS